MKHLMILLALLCLLPFSPARAATITEQRAAVQNMRENTLSRLISVKPDTQTEIQSAVGYAVFTNANLALIYISGGYGHGVAHDNRTGRDTYMQMASAGVGLGLGAKDYRTVFVFHDAKAFADFTTTGLDMSGNADAAAKVGMKGAAYSGAADILPGVRVYQLTNTGLLAQAMIQGTKYWVDSDLNNNAPNLGFNDRRGERRYND